MSSPHRGIGCGGSQCRSRDIIPEDRNFTRGFTTAASRQGTALRRMTDLDERLACQALSSGVDAEVPPESLPGCPYSVHDDGHLPRDSYGCFFHSTPLRDLEAPSFKGGPPADAR
jgi:hypothetical protein